MPHSLRNRRLLQDNRPPEIIDGYLVNDTFTTDRAAGAVNDTYAEPGPGRREVVDTGGKATITGGKFSIASYTAVRDPTLRYGGIARTPGVVFLGKLAITSITSGQVQFGFGDPNFSFGVPSRFNFTAGGVLRAASNGAGTVVAGAYSTGVEYDLAVIMRAAGSFYMWKASGNWLILWLDSIGSLTPGLPSISISASTLAYTLDNARVPATLWLPPPLVSDGFSAWGTSDGLGHAEGVAGGLGSGSSGLSMTAFYGTWGASGGVAQCSALDSGIGLAGRDVDTADMIATVKVTRSAGVAGLFVRENADDRVIAVHNGTNAQLIKRVAGIDTTLVNTAATYVAGAELRLICEGTKFRLFYNNVTIGSEQTISDVSLQAETLAGVYTTDTGNTFDDLVVYARGSGGEYAALDAF